MGVQYKMWNYYENISDKHYAALRERDVYETKFYCSSNWFSKTKEIVLLKDKGNY